MPKVFVDLKIRVIQKKEFGFKQNIYPFFT